MVFHSTQELGEEIRRARKRAGLTQRDLAQACGCGTRFISDLENGKPTVELGKALLVANMLSMDLCIRARSFS